MLPVNAFSVVQILHIIKFSARNINTESKKSDFAL